MATINIPEGVYPGFKVISELSDSDIREVTTFLNSFDFGEEFEKISNELNRIIGHPKGGILFRTIIGFNKLIEEDGVSIEDVADELTKEYLKNVSLERNKDRLKNNLVEILKNYSTLKLAVESRRNSLYNENNFHKSELLTDIRIVFDDDIANKNRIGIVLHKLHLKLLRNSEFQEMHIAMDIHDLKKLKLQIEKSILKDKLIREDYKNDFKFMI